MINIVIDGDQVKAIDADGNEDTINGLSRAALKDGKLVVTVPISQRGETVIYP